MKHKNKLYKVIHRHNNRKYMQCNYKFWNKVPSSSVCVTNTRGQDCARNPVPHHQREEDTSPDAGNHTSTRSLLQPVARTVKINFNKPNRLKTQTFPDLQRTLPTRKTPPPWNTPRWKQNPALPNPPEPRLFLILIGSIQGCQVPPPAPDWTDHPAVREATRKKILKKKKKSYGEMPERISSVAGRCVVSSGRNAPHAGLGHAGRAVRSGGTRSRGTAAGRGSEPRPLRGQSRVCFPVSKDWESLMSPRRRRRRRRAGEEEGEEEEEDRCAE